MKLEVIEALRKPVSNPKERFQELFSLYRKEKTASFALTRYFNASGYSPANYKSLEYELKKLYKITDKDLADKQTYKPTGVKKSLEEKIIEFHNEFADPYDDSAENFVVTDELKEAFKDEDLAKFLEAKPAAVEIPQWSKGVQGTNERKEFLKNQGVTDIPSKNKDLDAEIAKLASPDEAAIYEAAWEKVEEAYNNIFRAAEKKATEVVVNAPKDAQDGLRLRDEFPFLFDADCPDKLKILVADKITAFNNVIKGRKQIKDMAVVGMTEEEFYEAAVVIVQNFELNQLIYAELNYFKEHGKILGEHPIFKEEVLVEAVNNMSTKELTKRQKNLRTYISREEKTLEKMEQGDAYNELAQKLEDWKHEIELVTKRLDTIQ